MTKREAQQQWWIKKRQILGAAANTKNMCREFGLSYPLDLFVRMSNKNDEKARKAGVNIKGKVPNYLVTP